jgi:acyl dehydratase
MTAKIERYLEDNVPGEVIEFGAKTVTEDEIVRFAREFDPQPFHIDRDAAAASVYGGIIASGWHTASMMMRMMVDEFISEASSLGSPGLDTLRWKRPVRPGDTLRVRITIGEVRRSTSKPDRGVVHYALELLDQERNVVMTATLIGMMLARP